MDGPTQPLCLVTGSAGFIGSQLARRLLDDGWRVIGVDAFTDSYDPSEKRERAAALARHPRYRQVAGHLVDLPLSALLQGVEAVFHLAGRAGVRSSFQQQRSYWRDNVESTVRLVDACRTSQTVQRLVYASSSSVYGNATLPFREDAALAPLSPYGHSKLEAERYCLATPREELETVALRYFTVYGPGQRPDMGLRCFAEAALLGRPIRLFGDGTQTRDFTFVTDIVDATYRALGAPAAGLALNVGGGSRLSLLEVFGLLESLAGRPLHIQAEPVAPGDVDHTEADLNRARQVLGFEPRVSFADGYAQEVEWIATRLNTEAVGCA